jgi:hypothetical protein
MYAGGVWRQRFVLETGVHIQERRVKIVLVYAGEVRRQRFVPGDPTGVHIKQERR